MLEAILKSEAEKKGERRRPNAHYLFPRRVTSLVGRGGKEEEALRLLLSFAWFSPISAGGGRDLKEDNDYSRVHRRWKREEEDTIARLPSIPIHSTMTRGGVGRMFCCFTG